MGRQEHCLQRGPYIGTRVPIISVLASFTRRMSIQSACIQQWVILICLWWVMTCTVIIHICCEVMLHTLAILPNFDFYLCLRVKFHKSLFWVPILAAGGPYWVPISQKNGSLSQSLGVPISFGVSALGLHEKNLGPHSMWEQCLSHGVNFWVRCASGNVYMYTWDQA